jgi:hypothetical protein
MLPHIRRWMIITLVAAVLVMLISFLFGTLGGDKACNAIPYGIGPILAFEFARTPADLATVFGAGDSICRVQLMHAMDRINRLDYLYMPAYGLMLFAFILALSQGRRSARVKIGLACAILAPAADAVENWILLGLTKNLSAAPMLGLLKYPVHLKFMCIAIAGGVAGLLLWRRQGLWLRVAGLLCLPQLVPALIIILAPMSYSGALLTPLIALAWGLMLLLALVGAARPDLFRPSN